ncbi:NACHT domain-containing protein [Streptomyces fuscichromogenes]|uniref:NACHT domain-containing protein n=1 Tax=Streptomyces fuscichromogenes TaxID=1324013 RepID=UPI00166F99F0|nr:NACHT domain-containing protein [Streptomyces fuscichromogenes]
MAPHLVRAVLVAVEQDSHDSHDSLAGPAADVLRLARHLLDKGVPAGNISLLITPRDEARAETEREAEKLGLPFAPASLKNVVDNTPGRPEQSRCEVLILFWSGHGAMTDSSPPERILYVEDATAQQPWALSLAQLCFFLRQRVNQSLQRQVLLIDTCAWYLDAADGQPMLIPLPTAGRAARRPVEQFVLCASRDGQGALNHPGRAASEFAEVVLAALAEDPSGVPPDIGHLTQRVENHFNERNSDYTRQTPVTLYRRSPNGSERDISSGLTDARPQLPAAPAHLRPAVGELHERSRLLIGRFLDSSPGISAVEGAGLIDVPFRTLTRNTGHPPGAAYESVVRFYNHLPRGCLVVTGQAGSGKTFLAAHLVDLLLRQRRPRTSESEPAWHPVPVLIPLYHWKPPSRLQPDGTRSYEDDLLRYFENWLADELVVQQLCTHGRTARALVHGRWVLPVLDGLDEAHGAAGGTTAQSPARRRAGNSPADSMPSARDPDQVTQLVTAINRYTLREDSPVIVTTRDAQDDESPAARLQGCVVEMERLSVNDIETSLRTAFPGYLNAPEWADVRHDLSPQGARVVAHRLDTPWKLVLAIRALHSPDPVVHPHELAEQGHGVEEALHERLLAAFVPAACVEQVAEPPRWTDPAVVTPWLARLARHLESRDSGDLTLNGLWPMAGSGRVKAVQAVVHGLAVVFFALACVLAVAGGPGKGAYAWEALADSPALSGRAAFRFWGTCGFGVVLAGAAVFTACMPYSMIPKVVRRTRGLRLRRARKDTKTRLRRILSGCEIGSAIGTGFGLSTFLLFGPWPGIIVGCAVGIPLGWLMEAKVGLDRTLSGNFAPEFYWVCECAAALLGGVAGAVAFTFAGGGTWAGAVFGAAVGYFGSFAIGLIAWLRYVVAMSLMKGQGLLPWKMAAFLDWAHRVGILRVQGVSWQFRHAELRSWLAEWPDPDETPSGGGPRRARRFLPTPW